MVAFGSLERVYSRHGYVPADRMCSRYGDDHHMKVKHVIYVRTDTGPRLLLVQHAPTGEWSFAGGSARVNWTDYRSMEDCDRLALKIENTRRETLEETGMDVDLPAKLAANLAKAFYFNEEKDVWDNRVRKTPIQVRHTIFITDVSLDVGRDPDAFVKALRRDETEASDVCFVTLGELWAMREKNAVWSCDCDFMDKCEYFKRFFEKMRAVHGSFVVARWPALPWQSGHDDGWTATPTPRIQRRRPADAKRVAW
jgi:8-oxo-dGTP pyrophosphatase MutT (NUDIX family)